MRSLTVHAEKIKKYMPKTMYKIGSQFYIDKKYPRHLFIETTAKCNLTCAYCPREDVNDHMDFRLFKEIIDEASFYGPRSFSLHLFGEPLLWPKIIDGIRYIKAKHKRNVVLLTTNGTHLNRFVDDIIGNDVDEVIWSWRTEAKFRQETKKKLRDWGKFRVRIIKEVTPKEEIERWSKWPKVEIRSLHNYGGGIDLSKYGVPNVETRWKCYHLDFAPAVAWNGNMLLCCADPEQEEVLGNVKNKTVSEMWQSEKLKKIRKSHMKGEYDGICKNCDVWKNYPNYEFGHEFAIRKDKKI